MHEIKKIFSFLIPVIAFAVLIVFMAGCGSQEKAKLEEHKAFARQEIDEAWNKGNLDVLDEHYAADFILHMPPNPDIEGLEAYKQFIEGMRSGYPDLQMTIDEIIDEGDIGSMRYTFQGTQTGQSPTLGIPPTGKKVTFTGCSVSHWVDGKIVESWNYVDYLGLMQQLGFTITPPK